MTFPDLFAGDVGDQINQSVDADQLVGAEVQWIAEIGGHQAQQAFNAVVNVHVGPCLIAVAPDLDYAAVFGERDLAAYRRRRFLASAVVSTERPVDIVE